mmetsp:Transcript_82856/g.230510  ORF Transcript_82856/g.230510 Transcript_82856/m.230510 type:complete len:481 (-) Transcript_82856:118-1560(-)|eukprot:CAMPEP_0176208888 /NCGR_PEP_ID=MMETSP0121_2-20121125/13356_1 /TAXON_ID=160619 /ORGANISM="Kryptoperidinium foliaceum, Strain CCMP 1326" /LENGTH=480 /DNA_ID=CAMNT_0017547895 /DNA_START=75 /DNA_END=1517 /DNA_ORIENTATION=+
MTPALGLIALSLLSPSCDAVRRQTAGMVPDLPPAVPVQPFGVRMPPPQLAGQLQPISEQMPASRLNEGVAAYISSIDNDGAPQSLERRSPGGRWSAIDETVDELLDELKLPMDLGLDDFGSASSGGLTPWTPWLDLDDFFEAPPLPHGESVRRSVVIREENGKTTSREEVTRCLDGKCTTEVIRDDTANKKRRPSADEGSRSKRKAAKEAAGNAKSKVADEVDVVKADDGAAKSKVDAKEQGSGAAQTKSKEANDDGSAASADESKSAKAGDGVAAAPAPPSAGEEAKGGAPADAPARPEDGKAATDVEAAKDDAGEAPKTAKGAKGAKAKAERALAERAAKADGETSRAADVENSDETSKAAGETAKAEDAEAAKDDAGEAPKTAKGTKGAKAKAAAAAADEAAKVEDSKGAGGEGAAAPKIRRYDSVVRTVVIEEADGQRDGSVTIERCRDGECSKSVRRLGPEAEKRGAAQELGAPA